MLFEPSKSELIHFTKKTTKASLRGVRLGENLVNPTDSARFLDVWLDRKLSWKAHLKANRTKFASQSYALTRLAGSTWGYNLARAREIYTKVIRSAIAYRASAYYTPSSGGKANGIAKELAPL